VQFDSNFKRLVTKSEPGAVATGQGLNSKWTLALENSLKELEYPAGRYRSRFWFCVGFARLIHSCWLQFNIEIASVLAGGSLSSRNVYSILSPKKWISPVVVDRQAGLDLRFELKRQLD